MGKLRLYLDNCSFNRPYDDQTQQTRDTFDYTEWQQDLFEDMTIEEIASEANKLGESLDKNIASV